MKDSSIMKYNRFLYVLQAVELDENSPDWAGGIDALKRVIKRDGQQVKGMIESKMNKLQFEQHNLKSKLGNTTDKLDSIKEEQIQIKHQLKSAIENIKDQHKSAIGEMKDQLKSSNDQMKDQLAEIFKFVSKAK